MQLGVFFQSTVLSRGRRPPKPSKLFFCKLPSPYIGVTFVYESSIKILQVNINNIYSNIYLYINKIIFGSRGGLNTPDPQIYLGLVVGIWASLELDFSIFSIFYPILGLFIGKFLKFVTFFRSSLGLTK